MANTKNNTILKVAILTMSFVQMGTNGIAPILAQIAAAFPTATPTTIQFLMTFPSIFCLIFTMLTAFLSDHLPKKTLAVSGLTIVALTGILACLFHQSLGILFLWAGVLGIGIGMVAPLAPALINERFVDSERQNMLGWQNSASNIGSMLMTFFGGFLAAAGWNFGYLVYLLAIPGILFVIPGVPGTARKKADCTNQLPDTDPMIHANAQKKPDRGRFRLVIWKEMLITFILLMAYSAAPANLAMLIEEKQLGGTAVSGIMSTLFLLGGTVFGLFFGKLVTLLKKRTDTVGAVIFAIGALLIASADAIPLIAVGCFISGASISMIMPLCTGAASRLPGYETLNSALILSSSFVGVFVTPLLTSVTAVITGSSATSYRFYAIAVVAVILAVLTVLLKKEK